MHRGQPDSGCPKLCISQPAVSQAVRQLEKRPAHGFLRTSKGIRLTKGRRAFIPLCENGRGTASGRRQDAGENAGYGYGERFGSEPAI